MTGKIYMYSSLHIDGIIINISKHKNGLFVAKS